MAYHTATLIQVLLIHFEQFDKGESVSQEIAVEHGFNEGDTFDWECAQYDGQARVISLTPVSTHEVRCTFVKVS